ncbi:MAG: hypothetical protein WD016_08875 [Balneolaceae bacterium]
MIKYTLIVLLSVSLFWGCGSRDSQDQESAYSANDTTQSEITESAIDTLVTEKLTSDADTSGLIEKSGTLNFSGSEPFVTPTLFVSDSASFRLMGDRRFMKETFDSINGKHVTIYGKEQKLGNVIMLEVHYYKIRGQE